MEIFVLCDYEAMVETQNKRYYCGSVEQALEIAEFEKNSGNAAVVYRNCGQGLLEQIEE